MQYIDPELLRASEELFSPENATNWIELEDLDSLALFLARRKRSDCSRGPVSFNSSSAISAPSPAHTPGLSNSPVAANQASSHIPDIRVQVKSEPLNVPVKVESQPSHHADNIIDLTLTDSDHDTDDPLLSNVPETRKRKRHHSPTPSSEGFRDLSSDPEPSSPAESLSPRSKKKKTKQRKPIRITRQLTVDELVDLTELPKYWPVSRDEHIIAFRLDLTDDPTKYVDSDGQALSMISIIKKEVCHTAQLGLDSIY